MNILLTLQKAGSGYHNIYYTYGTGDCSQTIDTVIFVDKNLLVKLILLMILFVWEKLSSIGVNVSGGTSNYSFSWNNVQLLVLIN